MSVYTGKYKKLDTYYYDYHALAISLETSKIRKSCIEEEIKEYEEINPNYNEIKKLKALLMARNNIIAIQERELNAMKVVIESFPKHLKKIEYDVYYMSIIENKSVEEISKLLNYTPQYIRIIRTNLLNEFIRFQRATQM